MDTAAMILTSLPPANAAGPPACPEAQSSGKFGKILRTQAGAPEKATGGNPEGRAEEQRPEGGKEMIPLLLLPAPSHLPEKGFFPGEKEAGLLGRGFDNLGSGGAAQNSNLSAADPGAKNPWTAGARPEWSAGARASAPERPLSPGILQKEVFSKNPSNPDSLFSGKEAAAPPGEQAGIKAASLHPPQDHDGGEAFWENRKNWKPAGPVNFAADISAKETNGPGSETKLPDLPCAGAAKTGELFENPPAPPENPAGVRPADKAGLEVIPEPNRFLKPEVHEQVGHKMLWSLGRNEEKFRLALDPPQLGTIYLEIHRSREQVKASLWTENPNAKQILESSQLSIQKIIEKEGFSLESFNVFVERDLNAFQENRERWLHAGESAISLPAAEIRNEPGGPAAPPLGRREGLGGLRSIDLII
jgi:hypothetical protein